MIHSGDIAVSGRTIDTLMITSDDSNQRLNRAFQDSTVQLWNENLVNGKYVIAYELDPELDDELKTLLPKVYFRNYDRILKSVNRVIIVELRQ